MANVAGATPEMETEQRAKLQLDRPPTLTAEGEFLAAVFLELHAKRANTGWGPLPISWGDLAAYCRLKRLRLGDWALRLLDMADTAFLKWSEERAEKERSAAKARAAKG